MTPNMGGIPTFNPGSNPPTFGWNSQPDGQDSTHVSSYNPTSSEMILTNTFGMTNQPLSSGFQPRGVNFTLWETPNLDLIWMGAVSITLNRTFQLE
jgi:hypothetical protein